MHPIREPIRSGLLQVSDIHQIYWEESGNPDGLPVIFLHGGPGAGASPACRGFFNPDVFRIVIIDQRGCGRSLPYACTDDNTTWDLVADIEKVREMLGIQKWLVFGGSWGSTLSLAYAETHPERVAGLVLRGIFLCRPSEMAWLDEAGGVSQIYPAQWQKFLAPVAEEKRGSLIAAYHEMLFGEDETGRLNLHEADFAWLTHKIIQAASSCPGKIVSVLEGGYTLEPLAKSAAAHIGVLVGLPKADYVTAYQNHLKRGLKREDSQSSEWQSKLLNERLSENKIQGFQTTF